MKVVILSKPNSYVGREYCAALKQAGIDFGVITNGSPSKTGEAEKARCGGLWEPIVWEKAVEGKKVFHVKNLKTPEFSSIVMKEGFTLGVQAGVEEILRLESIKVFKDGIINFHPGKLPEYRGCSAPEWQLFENRPVFSTCHLLDEGIDTGPIICEKRLKVSTEDYFHFRASIYPESARFLVEVLNKYIKDGCLNSVKQNDENSQYRKYIGDSKIEQLKQRFSNRC